MEVFMTISANPSRRLLDILSVAALLLLAASALFFMCRNCRGIMLTAAGRTAGCAIDETFGALSIEDREARLAQSIRVVQREGAVYELLESSKGRFWFPKGDNVRLLASLLAEDERNIYGADDHWIRKGDVVLDCGAHVGTFTREALAAGAGLVVAIEPAPGNVECLRRNFAAEIASGRVIVYPKGLWDSESFLTFHVDPENSARNSLYINAKTKPMDIQVPLTTLDKLVSELRLQRVDFLKMDIEGAEPKALAGGAGLLSNFHPRLSICVYHGQNDLIEVPTAVRRARAQYSSRVGRCEDQGVKIIPQTLWFD